MAWEAMWRIRTGRKVHRRGRRTVTPGSPGLLVVPLDRLGQVQVRDEADIRLVDAHPERDRGHHDQPVLAQEPGLVRSPGAGVEEVSRAVVAWRLPPIEVPCPPPSFFFF